ncbi:glycosyltransferase [Blastopirellula sp. JC732]|uniref:Glycosyltransferase n=1 Tax=Blastopirellula sediminis TaxID=2894196 RepID=A0A9X1SFV9_9BACT|nr:glycosyltransferase [Blastopirellula sediminis]MCC9629560.1 glycosyltransferase [Blastopirellula sediminis]
MKASHSAPDPFSAADRQVKPLVSVVMPVLNPHPRHFREAVESVLAQTLADFELIIVEDPSPRDGRELIADLQDPRIVHVRNESRSCLRDQLNQGLRLAQADLIARADADDICCPQRLESQVARFAAEPELDVLGSRLEIIDDKGRQLGYRNYPLTHEEIVRAMRRFNPVAHPSVTFRRSTVLSADSYVAEVYVEDYDLWCRLAASGARFANDPQPRVRYRIHPEGMKSEKLKQMIAATVDLKRRYFHGEMTLAERTRLLAERGLIWMPRQLVLWLFARTAFSRTLAEN